jgi:hypothetical protein
VLHGPELNEPHEQTSGLPRRRIKRDAAFFLMTGPLPAPELPQGSTHDLCSGGFTDSGSFVIERSPAS